MGKELPIEPERPLISRSPALRPACIHCPNSPPSQTKTAVPVQEGLEPLTQRQRVDR